MKNRIPLLAFFLSLFISGLGQVYNGEFKKGLLFLLIIFPIYLVVGLTGAMSSFYGMLFIVVILLLYKIVISIEAYRAAKKLNPYKLKSINHLFKYILFTLLFYFGTFGATTLIGNLIGYEAFKISTSSSEPSVLVGERIMGTTFNKNEIQLGDLISYKKADGLKYLGRVLGLPNQEIKVDGDRVIYKDHEEEWKKTKISTEFQFTSQEYQSTLQRQKTFGVKKITKVGNQVFKEPEISNLPFQKIPANHIFIIGDNRNNSIDSRTFGPISLENVDKKIRYIWWSNSLERIGTSLD